MIIDGITPRIIETPRDADDLARLLKKYSDEQCAIIPRGGETMLDLGAPLQRADIVLSLEKLNRVIDYQPANLTVRAEAGITLEALNRTLAQHGQFLPLDPPFPDRATIGGILATNASGPLRVHYGAARDLLIGIRVALADGQIAKGGGQVVKNVAGYDLPKLFIGSLGTLGVIVEATFKLAPLPKTAATVFASFENLDDVCNVATKILQSRLLPNGLEILNRSASLSLGLGDGFALVARFGGVASAVERQARDVEKWSRDNGSLATTILGDDMPLWARLRDFIFEKETVAKIGVLPTQIGEIGAETERLAQEHGIASSFIAHAIGILFVALEGDLDHITNLLTALRKSVIAKNGHLTIQRAPRALRERVEVWGPMQSDFGVMQKLKKEFDPNGILNPGRFVGNL